MPELERGALTLQLGNMVRYFRGEGATAQHRHSVHPVEAENVSREREVNAMISQELSSLLEIYRGFGLLVAKINLSGRPRVKIKVELSSCPGIACSVAADLDRVWAAE